MWSRSSRITALLVDEADTALLVDEADTKLHAEDRDGNRLFEDDPDPAVLLGGSPVGYF